MGRQMVDGKGGRHWEMPAHPSASLRVGRTGFWQGEMASRAAVGKPGLGT